MDDKEKAPLQPFVCERCGFGFQKETDFPPHLCYRCMRFIAKSTWKIMHQIQPPLSRPTEGKDI
jgi:predicted Zn-ribbon and HTH transcriptional regulator